MTTSTTPDLQLITGTIGAVIDGVDLSRPLSPDQIDLVRRAVTDHQVVFFRRQTLSADELHALAAQFGQLTVHPVDRLVGAERMVATIVDHGEPPPAAFDWHTDLSWTPAPPRWGLLHGVEIPEVGGETLWASCFAMYDALGHLQQLCDTLAALHRASPALVASVRRNHGTEAAERLVAEHHGVVHPLVRVHPVSGRRALWLSKLYVTELVGDTLIDAELLLERLQRQLDDPHVQVRWRWRPGDLAIWDETSTCHRALGDHYPSRRIVRRCTIAGDPPAGVVPLHAAA